VRSTRLSRSANTTLTSSRLYWCVKSTSVLVEQQQEARGLFVDGDSSRRFRRESQLPISAGRSDRRDRRNVILIWADRLAVK